MLGTYRNSHEGGMRNSFATYNNNRESFKIIDVFKVSLADHVASLAESPKSKYGNSCRLLKDVHI